MATLELRHAASQYGAEMGRQDQLPDNREADALLYLRRMWINKDGEDIQGAYWGIDSRQHGAMYCAWGEYGDETVQIFVRAHDRSEAKTLVLKTLPNARFYR